MKSYKKKMLMKRQNKHNNKLMRENKQNNKIIFKLISSDLYNTSQEVLAIVNLKVKKRNMKMIMKKISQKI